MNRKFKEIMADGIALLVPLLVALYFIFKLIAGFRELLAPFAERLGIHHFFGRFTLTILAIIAIFLLTLMLGLMMEWKVVAKLRDTFERIMLRIFPSLNQLKVMAANLLNRKNATKAWKSVLLKEGDKYRFAFLVEETDVMGVFFVMKSQFIHDGDVEMLERDSYTYTEVDATKMQQSMRQFGVHASSFVQQSSS